MRRLLLSIMLICVLILPVSAHPGDTDSAGGHYDRETWEYHYHHGYPAHDHYDMDGDGDADCPYDFDDQTGVNSGSSSSGASSHSSSSNSSSGYTAKDVTTARSVGYTMGYDDGLAEGRESGYEDGYRKGRAEGSASTKTAALWIGGLAGALLLFLSYRRGKRHHEETERLTTGFQKEIEKLQAERDNLISEKKQCAAVPISLPELEKIALNMGVDLITAIRMRNLELKVAGKPQIYFDGSE